jgi:hypothetical protein
VYFGMLTSGFFNLYSPQGPTQIRCHNLHFYDAINRQRRLKQAAFPVQKTLDSYDFSLMPSLNRNRFLTLSKGDFVEKKENIIFLGNSGTGKSHLAMGLGLEMIKIGYKVKFISAAELVEELLLTNEEHKLGALEKRWLKFDLIINSATCHSRKLVLSSCSNSLPAATNELAS